MKNQLLFIVSLTLISLSAVGQISTVAYSNGDNLLNVGIGFGSPFFSTGYTSSLPVNPSVSFEHGITDEISVGGQLAYASSKFNYAYFGSAYSFKTSATYIGARGSYHVNDILDIDSKFDVYGGASLGYVVVNVSDNQGYSGAAASALGLGVFAGGKYFFAAKTAAYAEVGYQSLSVLNLGISFKF